jgi:hypothetical protein
VEQPRQLRAMLTLETTRIFFAIMQQVLAIDIQIINLVSFRRQTRKDKRSKYLREITVESGWLQIKNQ